MKAILKLEMPEACIKCPDGIRTYCGSKYRNGYAKDYAECRHPDCPLKPVEELRWEPAGAAALRCPKCKGLAILKDSCPHCGVKLLPPEEEE